MSHKTVSLFIYFAHLNCNCIIKRACQRLLKLPGNSLFCLCFRCGAQCLQSFTESMWPSRQRSASFFTRWTPTSSVLASFSFASTSGAMTRLLSLLTTCSPWRNMPFASTSESFSQNIKWVFSSVWSQVIFIFLLHFFLHLQTLHLRADLTGWTYADFTELQT